jgi:1H-pyrrole-2-carbonyl-[peptidyl-carrier protein] brominase
MFLLQNGIQSIIVEKQSFPRYHIGESFTGETGGQLRKLGMADVLDKEHYLVKHGTKVWGTGGANSFYIPVRARIGENGPQQDATTWQARRSEFDKLLMDTARSRGVEVIEGEAIDVLHDGDRVSGVVCRTQDGATLRLNSKVLVDASGQGTFLANKGVIGPIDRGNYDRQVAIFSQVVGATRDEGEKRDDTLIFYQKKNHWAWFIPLDEEVVSIGVVTPSEYFTSQKKAKLDFVRDEMRTLNPQLSWRVQNVKFVEEGRGASNYSYYLEKFTGKGFLCVGDSHRFIDPIFSLGLLFATKEAEFASAAIAKYLAGECADPENPFAAYERYVDRGQDIIQTMLDCFWEFPLPFQRFAHWTHQEEIIDLFAGRIYGDAVHDYDSVKRMRRLLDMNGIGRSGVPGRGKSSPPTPAQGAAGPAPAAS